MTQNREDADKTMELNLLFSTLDDQGQDNALTMLRSLDLAQSVMDLPKRDDKSGKLTKNTFRST